MQRAAIEFTADRALSCAISKGAVSQPLPVSHRMNAAGTASFHEPVLADAVVSWLLPRSGSVLVDATCGTGGHARALLPKLLPDGKLIAIDQDPDALQVAEKRLVEFESQVSFRHGNFRNLSDVLGAVGVDRVHGILADLGMSSPQVDVAERGFSFLREGPLDMRMDSQQKRTAEHLVNQLPSSELEQIIRTYGEDRFAARIARAIAAERKRAPIRTTTQLAEIIRRSVPGARGRIHPATRTFQALRISVNDELGALEALLEEAPSLLLAGGRLAIITYHSLEDRMVKQAFVAAEEAGSLQRLTKKVIKPSDDEISRNPRARSAKMRVAEKPL